MKKITLLIVSLLLTLGGVKSQPTSLPDETPKATGDYVLPIFSIYDGWTNKTAGNTTVVSTSILGYTGITDNKTIEFNSGDLDISMMDKLHVDIWISNDNNDIDNLGFFLYSRGGNDWYGIDKNGLANNAWNSIDINLSEYKAKIDKKYRFFTPGA